MRPCLMIWLLLLVGCPTDTTSDDDDGTEVPDDDDDDASDDDTVQVDLPVCEESVLAAFEDDEIAAPETDSDEYTIPTSEELDGMRASITALLDGDNAGALGGAELAGYELCVGADDESDLVLWRPDAHGTGHAVFALRTEDARPLILGTPHSWLEYGTLYEALTAFEQMDARALITTGTHRCANPDPAGCDGDTFVCGTYDEPYRESDMAHVVDSHFQVAHEVLADHFTEDWVFSIHGFPLGGISISNGTHEPSEAGTPVALFGEALMEAYAGETITSCNDWPGAWVQIRYCGTTNTQGRYINGSPDPCGEAATSSTERFLHMEQAFSIWLQPQPVIDALDSVLPDAE